MKPNCAIIIRAFNEGKHLGKLFDGIRCQTIQNAQIIVVDSGSTDDTIQIAEKNGAEIVHIKPTDFSFGRSLNVGIEKSRSKNIVICSAHVYPVYPDWLERLIAPLNDKKTAIAYGKQRGTLQSHYSEQKIFHAWYPDKTVMRQEHPFCNNANAAIKLDLWKKHPYNENLPALEDLEWARWVHDQGFLIQYIAEAEVIHVHNESWSGIANRYRREAIAFKQIYPYETFSFINMLKMFWQNSRSDFISARNECSDVRLHDIIRFRWAQFHGTYQGYHQSGPLTSKLKRTFYYPQKSIQKQKDEAEREINPINYDDQNKDKNPWSPS